MFRMRPILMLCFSLLPYRAVAAGAQRISLRENATTSTNRIVLDDLLPPHAPKWLHLRAESVVLGAAPQLGIARVLHRTQVERLVQEDPGLQRALDIPDTIVVRRAEHYLTRAEILEAIRDALKRMYPATAFELSPHNIELFEPVAVGNENPGLRVTRIEPDRDASATKFRLWTANEPEIQPFWVRVDVVLRHDVMVASRCLRVGAAIRRDDVRLEKRTGPVDLSNAAISFQEMVGRKLMRSVETGEVIDPAALAPDFLVLPGQKSALLLTSAGIHIETYGVALQRGVRGQSIRVRAADSGKVIVAKVIARQRLAAEF